MAREKINQDDYKGFHIRLPKATWLYLKKSAMLAECSMSDIVVSCLDKQRTKTIGNIKGEIDTHV